MDFFDRTPFVSGSWQRRAPTFRMPPQVVENDKKKIEAVIDELDQKKNQALQVFTGRGLFWCPALFYPSSFCLLIIPRVFVSSLSLEFLSPHVGIEHRHHAFQGDVYVFTSLSRTMRIVLIEFQYANCPYVSVHSGLWIVL